MATAMPVRKSLVSARNGVLRCSRRPHDRVHSRGACDCTRRMPRQRGHMPSAPPRVMGSDRMSRPDVGAFDPWCARERSVRAATQA